MGEVVVGEEEGTGGTTPRSTGALGTSLLTTTARISSSGHRPLSEISVRIATSIRGITSIKVTISIRAIISSMCVEKKF
jgi:hypothetical protein